MSRNASSERKPPEETGTPCCTALHEAFAARLIRALVTRTIEGAAQFVHRVRALIGMVGTGAPAGSEA